MVELIRDETDCSVACVHSIGRVCGSCELSARFFDEQEGLVLQ
jgi:hypothetical protein